MRTNRLYFILPLMVVMMLACIGCSSDGEKTNDSTIDYYGITVPYEPVEEKDMPVWLKNLMEERNMGSLYRICMGTLNGNSVYHLNLWTDSSLSGRFYDKDGEEIFYEGDFYDFIAQIRDVKCIYYYVYQAQWKCGSE